MAGQPASATSAPLPRAHARPQQKKGSVRQYGCRFNARLLYWVYYRPK